MRAAQHDAVNTKTLNVGRGGSTLDADFGAGAAEPTKLDYRRGYEFDGAADYMILSSFPSTAIWTVLLTLQSLQMTATPNEYLLDAETGRLVIGWAAASNVLQIYDGTWRNTVIYARDDAAIHTLAITNAGADVYGIYFDGESRGTVAGTSRSLGGDVALGAEYTGTGRWTEMNLYHAGIADAVLTPTQCLQYHRSQMKRLHQI